MITINFHVIGVQRHRIPGVMLTLSDLRPLAHNKTYFASITESVRKMRTAEPTLELALACLFAIFVSRTPAKTGRLT